MDLDKIVSLADAKVVRLPHTLVVETAGLYYSSFFKSKVLQKSLKGFAQMAPSNRHPPFVACFLT